MVQLQCVCVFMCVYGVKRRIVCIDGVKSLWCGNWGSKTVCVSNRKCVKVRVRRVHAPEYTCMCFHLHLQEKKMTACTLCHCVCPFNTTRESLHVCGLVCVCVVAGGLPHWARAGQLRCHRRDGEGPPSQEASSCQVFSSLCRGLHIR